MNIFATSPDPVESGRYLDSARQVKMILESCQMLTTALAIATSPARAFDMVGMRSTHANHPCNVWARASRDNWIWLWDHTVSMADDHQRRTGNPRHASVVRFESLKAWRFARFIQAGSLTVHANAARNSGLGVDFTWVPDVYQAYRLYLNTRWQIQLELAARGQKQKPVLCSFLP